MVSNPVIKPDPPIPDSARPKIKSLEELAAPEMRDPISKMATPVRNAFCQNTLNLNCKRSRSNLGYTLEL